MYDYENYSTYGGVVKRVCFEFSRGASFGYDLGQQFAYAYDELERQCKLGSQFRRVAIYTALFKRVCSMSDGFAEYDPFALDVLNELKEIYQGVDEGFFETYQEEADGLREDVELIKNVFLTKLG
ncbi:hypothetical protein HA052_14690 [Chromobacterium haemolyticum]|uniref:DUF4375 domain-containing protein n=1 Tax=Chromobacterium fluminis TaxID=3044269 RepID=A0ABX0LBT6_9NEIS|nr:hypothetical protein [Chromobacterium haemolyticum]NHR06438.1 hypothetical protein [Chromobacterium haemolyticum]